MENEYFYSEKNHGFYLKSLKHLYEISAKGWPADAMAITEELYRSSLSGNAEGKIIAAENGYPVLKERPPMNSEQIVKLAESKRDSLLSFAKDKIAIWQTRLVIGRALSSAELMHLNAWLDYTDALELIDLSAGVDIVWPEKP
ncbi:phage tail protein [Erwinia psidii]|uniref:tail fiber assembly protein n=1 Tax=Erwinia psidii TaxID=69224 RepID=UPI00226B7CD0|nr:tail fiber assembly protein [Erwinia psidii]MCX8966795.1 phage tail protein [Erwinia psidii]